MTKTSMTSGNFGLIARDYISKMGGSLGRIGKALLYPIAVLPIAAIMLRIGAAIPTDNASDFAKGVASFITNAGDFAFANLHILFAVGIAFGLTKDARGEAALAGFVGIALLTVLMSKGGVDLTGKIYGNIDLGRSSSVADTYKYIDNAVVAGQPLTATKVIDVPASSVRGFAALFTGGNYNKILATNVLSGFFAGGLVAYIYNRFQGVQLPSVLGFFSGRRLVPVLAVMGIMTFGILYAIVFPWVGYILYVLSDALAEARGNKWANAGIMGVYGILNRLLIPFGLHHIPNSFFWFGINTGSLDAKGAEVYGDIYGFINGVALGNTSGTFQSGFFPVMMFGLPAIALAFYFTADDKEQKRQVAAMFGSAALVSFLTGITEPIEFAFLFVAPWLYAAHALLTGIFGFITGAFGIQLGFGFSAGLLDYGLSIPKSISIIDANKTGVEAVFAHPGWIWAIGAVAATVYFFVAKYMIKFLNLQTPGRGKGRYEMAAAGAGTVSGATHTTTSTATGSHKVSGSGAALPPRAAAYVKALGGYNNITNFTNCTTRLRYDVVDSAKVDAEALKKAGAKGVMKVSKNHVHVIVGLDVEKLNDEIIAGRPAGNN